MTIPEIVVLSSDVIDRIAAGEVIERPAAVLKELVENSLDAGASRIEVELSGAGSELISVRDDGCGMAPEAMHLALERHATSKIRDSEDLAQVRSLGFRGEALPSVASVARLEMTSAPAGALSGHRLVVEGAKILREETVPFPQGTLVQVRDLFFNTPARRKFVRSPQSEWRHLMDAATRLALSRPDVSFRVKREGKTAFHTPGRGDLDGVVLQVWGKEIADQLVPVEMETPGARIQGRVGLPSLYRSNRQQELLFLNGRWVREQLLQRAVEEAYRRVLAAGRFPVTVLFVETDPGELDPNVHPTKSQVRLRRPEALMAAVRQAVEQALGRFQGGISAGEAARHENRRWSRETGEVGNIREQGPEYPGVSQPELFFGEKESIPGEVPEEGPPDQGSKELGSLPELQVLGQVYNNYILARGPSGLFLVEQHAAHERVVFEDVEHNLRNQEAIGAQALLVPLHVELSPAEAAVTDTKGDRLADLGFRTSFVGERDVLLRSIPRVIGQGQEIFAFRETLQALGDEGLRDDTPWAKRLALVLACHGSIRSGQALAQDEAQALLDQLRACQQPATCPHGRPTLLHISHAELDQRFRRGQ